MDFKLTLNNAQRKTLKNLHAKANSRRDMATLRRINGLLSLEAGYLVRDVAAILQISGETIRQWVRDFLAGGLDSIKPKLKTGRPPKLTKKQRKTLYDAIASGPQACGFSGGCWRTPMIQELIVKKFGVYFNVHYLSEYLKNLGFSFQRATFIATQRDAEARTTWISQTWTEIFKLQEEKGAYVLFGDECSFAQWGSLSRTWAPIGQTPLVETRGTRKNYKVFGAIDFKTGRLFHQGIDGKLNGQSYVNFLKGILANTRKHIILIQDGAPYHKSKLVKEFIQSRQHRLTVYTLPSYSPDYNPIEKLWKKIKEGYTHLQYFETFESLVEQVEDALESVTKKVKTFIKPLFEMYEKLSKHAVVQA